MKVLHITIILAITIGCSEKEKPGQMELWFDSPAERWFEATAIGNGMQGAMIYGGVSEDLVSLTENTYYSGAVSDHIKEGASDHMPAIRQALISQEEHVTRFNLLNSFEKFAISSVLEYISADTSTEHPLHVCLIRTNRKRDHLAFRIIRQDSLCCLNAIQLWHIDPHHNDIRIQIFDSLTASSPSLATPTIDK